MRSRPLLAFDRLESRDVPSVSFESAPILPTGDLAASDGLVYTERIVAAPHRTFTRKAGEGLVVTGERVLAIGFPLNQEMTLTTGIVSGVRDGAIISDVNINHGNSGGPMMNLAGEVVAFVEEACIVVSSGSSASICSRVLKP